MNISMMIHTFSEVEFSEHLGNEANGQAFRAGYNLVKHSDCYTSNLTPYANIWHHMRPPHPISYDPCKCLWIHFQCGGLFRITRDGGTRGSSAIGNWLQDYFFHVVQIIPSRWIIFQTILTPVWYLNHHDKRLKTKDYKRFTLLNSQEKTSEIATF